MATKIQLRRDTLQNWQNTNPVLSQGEPSFDLTNKKLKIGDGITQWNNLEYVGSESAGTVEITATNTNQEYPLVFASGTTSSSLLLRDNLGGTYNPSTNLASIDISGIAEKAKTLNTPREIRLNGALLGSAMFDGSSNIVISASIKPNIELSTGPIIIENVFLIDTTSTASTTQVPYVVDSFDVSEYRTAKYLVQITRGTEYHATEVLVVHNDISAFLTEYGTVFTDVELGFLNAEVNSGEVKLTFTPNFTNTVVRVVRNTIKVA